MNGRKVTVAGALAAVTMLGIAAYASQARANCLGTYCSATSASWDPRVTASCGANGSAYSDGGYAYGNNLLAVNLNSGFCARAEGLTSGGSVISTCTLADYAADGNSVYIASGCNSAVKHRVTVGHSVPE